MSILLGKLFYTYITRLMAKQVNLRKFMIIEFASTSPGRIINERDEETSMMSRGGQGSGKSDFTNTVIAVHYRLRDRRENNWMDTAP